MVLGTLWEDQSITFSRPVTVSHSSVEEIVTVYLVELKSYENNDKSTANLRPYRFESTYCSMRYPVAHAFIV
jgi:hypothetical protein